MAQPEGEIVTEQWLARIEGDDGDTAQYSWEASIERTWEQIAEDESTGMLRSVKRDAQRIRRKTMIDAMERSRVSSETSVVERGMIRYLYVALDMGIAMEAKDLKPSRKVAAAVALESFIKDFFDQNPISHLGICISKNRRCNRLTELSGNPLNQIKLLTQAIDEPATGEFSLQNTLELAARSLKQIPDYGSREILVIVGSLTTCDPGDIFQTVKLMQELRIRCSVISLAAEVHVYRHLAESTKGQFDVVLTQSHLKDLLFQYVSPPPIDASYNRSRSRKWVQMGFPTLTSENYPSMCGCHTEWTYRGFTCPKCLTKYCELPTTCKICGLTLVSSSHLARSYHHLFPTEQFAEVDDKEVEEEQKAIGSHHVGCFSCAHPLDVAEELVLRCRSCNQLFCSECDEYIHQTLYNCPGCLGIPTAPPGNPDAEMQY
jgi:transcription initiation factor TFIIH subunit 2